jgi:hypothetical protein
MRVPLVVLLSLVPAYLTSQQQGILGKPARTIEGIPGPESIAVGPDGAWYVSSFGKFDNGADGAVYRVDPDKGTSEIYAGGLEDPCGVLFLGNTFWVADRKGGIRTQIPGGPGRGPSARPTDRAGELGQPAERVSHRSRVPLTRNAF